LFYWKWAALGARRVNNRVSSFDFGVERNEYGPDIDACTGFRRRYAVALVAAAGQP
jgi:hypothetical protein